MVQVGAEEPYPALAVDQHVGPVVDLAAGHTDRRAEPEVKIAVAERDRGDQRAPAAVVEREHLRDHAGREQRGEAVLVDPVGDDREVVELGGGVMPAVSLAWRSQVVHSDHSKTCRWLTII